MTGAAPQQGQLRRALGGVDWRALVMAARLTSALAVMVVGLFVPNNVLQPAGRPVLYVCVVLLLAGIVWLLSRRSMSRAESVAALCLHQGTIVVAVWWAPQVQWLVIAQLVAIPAASVAMFGRRGVAVCGALALTLQLELLLVHDGTGHTPAFYLACLLVLAAADALPAVAVLTLTRQLEAARAAAARLAVTDQLTGLLNRHGLAEAWPQVAARAAAAGERVAVVVADIDHFKAVNDTRGHDVGDQVLVAVSRALGSVTRGSDLLVRLGGEELAWVGVVPDDATAAETAERLRAAVEAVDDGVPRVTVSAGAATAAEQPAALAAGLSALLTRADAALYEAKRTGRNRVVSTAAVAV